MRIFPERTKILLVDDEEQILAALRRTLRREGYEIFTAETWSKALAIADEHPIDLVVSDHKMPGMDGMQLLAEIARRRPEAARVLITGWVEAVPRDQLESVGVKWLLPKPWDDAELKKALREALEAR